MNLLHILVILPVLIVRGGDDRSVSETPQTTTGPKTTLSNQAQSSSGAGVQGQEAKQEVQNQLSQTTQETQAGSSGTGLTTGQVPKDPQQDNVQGPTDSKQQGSETTGVEVGGPSSGQLKAGVGSSHGPSGGNGQDPGSGVSSSDPVGQGKQMSPGSPQKPGTSSVGNASPGDENLKQQDPVKGLADGASQTLTQGVKGPSTDTSTQVPKGSSPQTQDQVVKAPAVSQPGAKGPETNQDTLKQVPSPVKAKVVTQASPLPSVPTIQQVKPPVVQVGVVTQESAGQTSTGVQAPKPGEVSVEVPEQATKGEEQTLGTSQQGQGQGVVSQANGVDNTITTNSLRGSIPSTRVSGLSKIERVQETKEMEKAIAKAIRMALKSNRLYSFGRLEASEENDVNKVREFLFKSIEQLVRILENMIYNVMTDHAKIMDDFLRQNRESYHESGLKVLNGIKFRSKKEAYDIYNGINNYYKAIVTRLNYMRKTEKPSEVMKSIGSLVVLPHSVALQLERKFGTQPLVIIEEGDKEGRVASYPLLGFRIALEMTDDIIDQIEEVCLKFVKLSGNRYDDEVVRLARRSLRALQPLSNLSYHPAESRVRETPDEEISELRGYLMSLMREKELGKRNGSTGGLGNEEQEDEGTVVDEIEVQMAQSIFSGVAKELGSEKISDYLRILAQSVDEEIMTIPIVSRPGDSLLGQGSKVINEITRTQQTTSSQSTSVTVPSKVGTTTTVKEQKTVQQTVDQKGIEEKITDQISENIKETITQEITGFKEKAKQVVKGVATSMMNKVKNTLGIKDKSGFSIENTLVPIAIMLALYSL